MWFKSKRTFALSTVRFKRKLKPVPHTLFAFDSMLFLMVFPEWRLFIGSAQTNYAWDARANACLGEGRRIPRSTLDIRGKRRKTCSYNVGCKNFCSVKPVCSMVTRLFACNYYRYKTDGFLLRTSTPIINIFVQIPSP